jgi:hypothetical protein
MSKEDKESLPISTGIGGRSGGKPPAAPIEQRKISKEHKEYLSV